MSSTDNVSKDMRVRYYSIGYLEDLLQEYVNIMGYDFDTSKHGVLWCF